MRDGSEGLSRSNDYFRDWRCGLAPERAAAASRGSRKGVSKSLEMRTSKSQIVILSSLLAVPAWACDMGSLFEVIVLALGIGAAICSLVSGLLAWGMRSAPLAAPVPTLLLSLGSGTLLGIGAGVVVSLSMSQGFEILWATLLVSMVVSSAVVTFAPSASTTSAAKLDVLVAGLPEPGASLLEETPEWKTLD